MLTYSCGKSKAFFSMMAFNDFRLFAAFSVSFFQGLKNTTS